MQLSFITKRVQFALAVGEQSDDIVEVIDNDGGEFDPASDPHRDPNTNFGFHPQRSEHD